MTRLLPLLLLSFALSARAAPVSPADADFFEKSVRPVLADNCWSCHGPKKQSAGLRLDSRAAILKGGESGPAINEKEPDKSLILSAIGQVGMLKMPPKKKLPVPAIDALTHWVKLSAPWPETATQAQPPDWRKHWAFQSVSNAVPPVSSEDRWSQTSIDRFIWTKLHEKGLSPSAEADRRVLIRRVMFDLTGLPPTPEQVDAILADNSPAAYDRLVAELLRSPAFGEHWGRFWLDVAR